MQKTIIFKPQSFFRFDKNVRDVYPPEIELRAMGVSYIKRWIAPVLAQPDGTVLDGHCRLLGVKLVDPEFLVPTIITEAMLKPAEIAQIQLVSAIQRNGLSAPAITKGIAALKAEDPALTNQQIADLLNFADSSLVTRYLAVYNCVEPIQQKYFAGEIGVSKVYEMSKQQIPAQLEMVDQNLLTASRSEMKAHFKKPANANGVTTVRKQRAVQKKVEIKIPVGNATVSVRGSEGTTLVDVAALLRVLSDTALQSAQDGDTLEAWATKIREQQWLATLPMVEETADEQSNVTA